VNVGISLARTFPCAFFFLLEYFSDLSFSQQPSALFMRSSPKDFGLTPIPPSFLTREAIQHNGGLFFLSLFWSVMDGDAGFCLLYAAGISRPPFPMTSGLSRNGLSVSVA